MATSKASQSKKKRVVAAGALAGARPIDIARAANCSVRQVNRLQHDPATQFLIAQALVPYHANLRKLAKKALAVVDRSMVAQKKTNADFVTQLRAVERFGDLVVMAAGAQASTAAAGKPGRRLVSWEELLAIKKAREEMIA